MDEKQEGLSPPPIYTLTFVLKITLTTNILTYVLTMYDHMHLLHNTVQVRGAVWRIQRTKLHLSPTPYHRTSRQGTE
jgi:hypothetical protein